MSVIARRGFVAGAVAVGLAGQARAQAAKPKSR